MAKERERGLSRAEEAFSALSSVPRERGPGPWRLATILLLLLTAGLGVTLALREARARRAAETRRGEALDHAHRASVELVDGDLPAAIRELGAASGEPVAADAGNALARAVARRGERLLAAEREVEDLRARLARIGDAANGLLAGDPEGAMVVLAGTGDPDGPERFLGGLAARLAALEGGLLSSDGARRDALRGLSSDWPLPALEVLVAEEEDRARRAAERAGARELARARLAAGDPDAAREALRDAASVNLEELYDGVWRARLRRLAEECEAAGAWRDAAAAWSVCSLTFDPERAARAEELRRRVDRETLASALRERAERALAAEDYEASGAFVEALGGVLGTDTTALRDAARANARLRDARELRAAGELQAALVLAREAAGLGSPAAAPLVREISSRLDVLERRGRIERAWRALALGAAGSAAGEVEGMDPPADLTAAIAAARAGEEVRAARAELRTGDLEAGLAGLPEKGRGPILLGTAVEVFSRDAMRSVALAKRAAAGGEEGLLAAVIRALALEGTDRAPDAHALWVGIRDRALEKAPLPEPEPEEDPGAEEALR